MQLLVLRVLLVLALLSLGHTSKKGQGTRAKCQGLRLLRSPSEETHITNMSPIANMSLSPWTYIDTYKEDRVPHTISQAQCVPTGCQMGGEDLSLRPEPIYYEVLVLHRVKRACGKSGRKRQRKAYEFRLGSELIAVGCTCVRPSVVLQQD